MEQGLTRLGKAFMAIFGLYTLLGMHYFQHNQGGSALELPINAVGWIFLSVLIAMGLWQITLKQKIHYSAFTLSILAAFFLFLAPVFYPNNEFAEFSYPRLMGFFAGFLFFLGLQQFNFKQKHLYWLLLLLVLAGLLESGYSLMQNYLLKPGNVFGFDPNYGRPYGIFQQPNALGSFMATCLVLSGYLLVSWKQEQGGKAIFGLLLLSALATSWVLVISLSRTGYLGAAIALLLLTPWALKNQPKRYLLFILALLIGVGASLSTGNEFKSRNQEQMLQAGYRALHYEHSWYMLKEKPLLGWGYGSFEASFLESREIRSRTESLAPEEENLTHPHNETLFWAVEGGLVPVVAILILVISFVFILIRFSFVTALAYASLLVPLAVHSQTEYPFYLSTAHWAAFLLLAFFVDASSKKIKAIEFRPYFLLRTSAILIVLIAVPFMISTLHSNYLITKYERDGRRDLRILLEVVNPMAFISRLEFNIYTFRLAVGMQLDKPEEVEAYADWAQQIVKHSPKSNIYYNWMNALDYLGKKEEAKEVRQYAQRLFPRNQLINASESVSIVRDIEKAPSDIASSELIIPEELK